MTNNPTPHVQVSSEKQKQDNMPLSSQPIITVLEENDLDKIWNEEFKTKNKTAINMFKEFKEFEEVMKKNHLNELR